MVPGFVCPHNERTDGLSGRTSKSPSSFLGSIPVVLPRAPVSHRRERVLPNGCMQIILNLSRNYLTDCGEDGKANRRLPRAIVVGTRARYGVVDTADMEEIVGIVIQPGGFAGLFRERADLFFERSIGLEEVWAGTSLTDRLCDVPTPVEKLRTLEVFLTGRLHLHPGTRRSELVDQAMHLFREKGFRVAECARSVGVSERRLSQVFREQVGIEPQNVVPHTPLSDRRASSAQRSGRALGGVGTPLWILRPIAFCQ